jgi:hypothetical protein
LIQNRRLLLALLSDCILRALFNASIAARALIIIDTEGDKLLTYAGRTPLILDVGIILIPEILKRG